MVPHQTECKEVQVRSFAIKENLDSPLPQPAPWVTFVAPPVASTAPPTQTGVAIKNNADRRILSGTKI